MNPNNQAYYSSAGGGNSRRRVLFIVGLVVVILLAALYLVFGGGGDNPNNNTTDSEDNAGTFALSTLTNPKLLPPQDTKGYIKRTNFTIDIGDYTTSNNACNFQFGVAPATELPGATPETIAENNLGISAAAGATEVRTKAGGSLELKGANSSSKYVMPIQEYEYVKENLNYKARFAVAILKENKRAYARWYCASPEGAVASKDFNKVSDKVKEIRVQPE